MIQFDKLQEENVYCTICGSKTNIKIDYSCYQFDKETGKKLVSVNQTCPKYKFCNIQDHYNTFIDYYPIDEVPPKPIVEQSATSINLKYGIAGVIVGLFVAMLMPWWITLPILSILIVLRLSKFIPLGDS